MGDSNGEGMIQGGSEVGVSAATDSNVWQHQSPTNRSTRRSVTHSLTYSLTDLLQVIGHLLGLGWLARTWTRLDATSVDSIKEYYGQARHSFLCRSMNEVGKHACARSRGAMERCRITP